MKFHDYRHTLKLYRALYTVVKISFFFRPLSGPDLAAHYSRRAAKVGMKMLEYKQKMPAFFTYCSLDQLTVLLTLVYMVAKA